MITIGAPGVSGHGLRGCHIAIATTSQPWPWAEVRGERGVTAETTMVVYM